MFEGAPISANWDSFLRSNANKDERFRYLSGCIHACETGRKVIISTKDETIVSTQNDMSDVEYLQPCSHEEADTRILFHVAHCARQGLRKLVIRTMWLSLQYGISRRFGLMNTGLDLASTDCYPR